MAHPEVVLDYTSASSVDTTSFSATAPARWIQCYGAGSVMVSDNGTTPTTRTYTVNGSETITGEWTAYTSTTCSRVRIGTTWPPPPALPSPAPTNLAGGTSAVNGILPGTNIAAFTDNGTVNTASFAALPGYVYTFNFQATGAQIAFPKATALIDGQTIGLINQGTGATANTIVPTGTDNVGVFASGNTAGTAATPASLKTQVYTAVQTIGSWVPGL
jgi:hypothetical protein